MSLLFPHVVQNDLVVWLVCTVVVLFVFAWVALAMLVRGDIRAIARHVVAKILLGWMIVLPLYLVGIFSSMALSVPIVSGVLMYAVYELATLAKLPRAYLYVLLLLTVGSVWTAAFFPEHYLSLPLLYMLTLGAVPIVQNDGRHGFRDLSYAFTILVWIAFFGAHIVLVGHLDYTLGLDRALLATLLLGVSLSDIGAYVLGRPLSQTRLGQRTKIAPEVTPNKTWIGLVGHIAGAALGVGLLYPFTASVLSVGEALVLAGAIGFFGLLGGLLNSLFKRHVGVKDTGNVLPGHGGVVDRIDSVVRVVAMGYYLLLMLV